MFVDGVFGRVRCAAHVLLLGIGISALAQWPSLAADSISLAWDPSPGTNIAGYHLYYGVASGAYTNSVVIGAATNATISGLAAGQTYYFAAAAFDDAGLESDLSNEVLASTPAPRPPTDTAPWISAIADQSTVKNLSTAPIGFTIGDAETDAADLVLSATSSAPALLPVAAIQFAGADGNRTVRLNPAPGQVGQTFVTVCVSDGVLSSSTTFALTVTAAPAITLSTTGNGTITPDLSGQRLVIGRTYTVTATPQAGQEFAGWTGSITSSAPTLRFALRNNMVLEASFVTSPYVPVQGLYTGLFYEQDQVRQYSSGAFALYVNNRGYYSGRLALGPGYHAFAGRLNLQCQATNVLAAGAKRMRVEMQTGALADQLSGRVTGNGWIAELSANRSVFDARTNPAPWAGIYTLVIPGQSEGAPPLGDGFGVAVVSSNGTVLCGGSLGDHYGFSRSAYLSKEGLWPLYSPLYSNQGSVLSWLTFTNRSSDDINGALSWIRPACRSAASYPAGFTNECLALGSRYVPPTTPGNPLLNLTNASVAFMGGNLATDFTNSICLGQYNCVTNRSSNRLGLVFYPRNGFFRGGVIDPSSGRPMLFGGAVFQKQNTGFGLLVGTNLNSRVVLAE
jgi:hypothetical protein